MNLLLSHLAGAVQPMPSQIPRDYTPIPLPSQIPRDYTPVPLPSQIPEGFNFFSCLIITYSA